MPEIVTNEFGRIVSVDGRTDVPHNTDILKAAGASRDYEGIDPFYAQRGNAVHLACHLLVKKTLDENSLDGIVRPYLEDFKTVLKDPDLKVIHSEIPLYSSLHDFCTTVDLIVIYKGKREIWDIKTAKNIDPSVELQTAANQIAWEENHREEPIEGRRYLQLTGNGDPDIGNDHSHVPPYLFLDVYRFAKWKVSHTRSKSFASFSRREEVAA